MYRSKSNAGPTMERGKNYISNPPAHCTEILKFSLKKRVLWEKSFILGKNFCVRINANNKSKNKLKTNKPTKPLHMF